MSTLGRRISVVAAVALAAGCGLSTTGLETDTGDASVDGAGGDATGTGSHDGSGSSGGDAKGGSSSGADGTASSSGSGGDATTTDTGGKDVAANDGPVETGTKDVAAPCNGDTKSCGQPGQCVDCTGSPQGSACVGGVCGCNDPKQDCPANNACSAAHTCGTACVGGLSCNGGCCNGASCVDGSANAACGNNGNACQSCAGQNPTCTGGSCHSNCGGSGDGTCGTGFCCGGGNCAGNTDPQSCGLSGQACVNCATSPNGPKCSALGVCGCNGQSDCTKAPGGSICGPAGVCGCAGGGDCPPQSTCGANFQCTNACSVPGQPCNSGCCTGNTGTCVASCPGGNNCDNGSCQ